MGKSTLKFALPTLLILATLLAFLPLPVAQALQGQDDIDTSPPAQPIKLIFIHHSTGENWLADGYGDLGRTLAENNYFVSDTNYGWGPDSIGDATDIPNWLDWFASDQTPTYTAALFSESDQHANYTRLFDDPGGENQVILFKSCFPNSALEGSPDDHPDPEGWLSVGHAKYVYNQILSYFSTRPDKLFIVITAPPLSDPTYAENTRAFNQWLVNDWLSENEYTLPNVAVFDFYTLLTARGAHHRVLDGVIEHSYTDSNTLAYPSGDDHPSEAGSRKATEEFLPLLNVFYHRWLASVPVAQPPPVSTSPPPDTGNPVPLPPETVLMIDDFETPTTAWVPNWDTATTSTITCAISPGTGTQSSNSLRIDFAIQPGSWGTCALSFDKPQDWSGGEWLSYDLHTTLDGLPYNWIVYAGTPDQTETYLVPMATSDIYPEGFLSYGPRWPEFTRASWEENAGAPFDQPQSVIGLAFGFDGLPDLPNTGTVFIDNIHLEKSPTYDNDGSNPPSSPRCVYALLLPLAMTGFALLIRRR